MSPGDIAENLRDMALDLAVTVRDESREGIEAKLREIPDQHKDALLVVMAAMVDIHRPLSELLSWVTWDENGRPLHRKDREALKDGRDPILVAHAAAVKAKKNGQPIPAWARKGELEYYRRNYRKRKELRAS